MQVPKTTLSIITTERLFLNKRKYGPLKSLQVIEKPFKKGTLPTCDNMSLKQQKCREKIKITINYVM